MQSNFLRDGVRLMTFSWIMSVKFYKDFQTVHNNVHKMKPISPFQPHE